MDHFLVCTVRKNQEGQEEAQLDGFVQNCDLKAAQQYLRSKRKQENKMHSGHTRDSLRLFRLVEVQ